MRLNELEIAIVPIRHATRNINENRCRCTIEIISEDIAGGYGLCCAVT